MEYWQIIFRAIIAFFVLLIWCRLLGKKLIAQVTFFDYVAGITIGSVAANMMLNVNISLWVGVAGLSMFCLLALVLDWLGVKSYKVRKVGDGEPLLIIKQGKILEEAMKKGRLNMDNLLFMLRKKNIFYLDEVELAYFETDGTISALKKSDIQPVTRQDMNLSALSRGVPQAVVIDGHLIKKGLQELGKDERWLKKQLEHVGVDDWTEVKLAQVDQTNQMYVDRKNDLLH
ncbi:DUF421 domain-containing protein [Bacillus sp. 31A1R]|uniref:DUF421 domain-containing protein n=1 Tax=Robertmurraya mangrovi TaxID=3098077 RepID=A0ABU5IWS0_9BACI|nr:DUF421 domain-containing protein [Bacillus sp. 31A1R]MDZ5471613.1 DUF421 domain-containing protein [Bacillus sp. 31A1R]